MKRKGFTLIELLAVIVILAIIALISTPIVIRIIDRSRKGAFEDSAYGVLDAGKLYVVNKIADDAFIGANFDFAGNVDHLKLSGDKPAGGKLILDFDGKQGLALWDKDKRWCAYKDYAEEKITIKEYVEEDCKIIIKWNAAAYIRGKNTAGNAEGLYTDDKGNTRYAGNNTVVKNYVRYNNEDWRIIGVFDGKLKIMKENNVRTKQWNDTVESNNWSTSTLQAYLNEDYYNSLTSEAKNMIEETKYYLGGHSTTFGVMKNAMYDYERGTTVYTGNQAEWTGKVALVYASDYGYAVSSECTSDLLHYSDSICTSNNWMYKTETRNEWLLTPKSDTPSHAFHVTTEGYVSDSLSVASTLAVRPALHLKPNISITGGDGTQKNPYIIDSYK